MKQALSKFKFILVLAVAALLLQSCSKHSIILQESDILGCYNGYKDLKGPETIEQINTEIAFEFNENGGCTVLKERSNQQPLRISWHLDNSGELVLKNSPHAYLNRSYRISDVTYKEVRGQQVISSFVLKKGDLSMQLERLFNPDSTIQREYYDILYIDEKLMKAILEKQSLDVLQVCSIYVQMMSPSYYNYPNPLEYYVVDFLFQNPKGNQSFRETLSFQNEDFKEFTFKLLYEEVIKKYGDSYQQRSKIETDFPFFKDWDNPLYN